VVHPDPGLPTYLAHPVPTQLLGGAAVGLTISSLPGADSGILHMAVQVGSVLGVTAGPFMAFAGLRWPETGSRSPQTTAELAERAFGLGPDLGREGLAG
jgi:hypothetical protein